MIVFHGPATNIHKVSSTSHVTVGSTVALLGIGTFQVKILVDKPLTILRPFVIVAEL